MLLKQGCTISHIILAGHAPALLTGRQLPVATPATSTMTTQSIQQLAAQYAIPVHYFSPIADQLKQWQAICHAAVHKPDPDFIFVACFPSLLPDLLLNWPRKFCVNLHPSLLPAYRGPDPVFWQLRNGETHTGISLHLITPALDAGPILHQQLIAFPTGATRTELDTLLSSQGAMAFSTLLATDSFASQNQPQQQSHYQSAPTRDDYTLETDWTAERAYNFMRGTHMPPGGYPILLNGTRLHLKTPVAFNNDASLNNRIQQKGSRLQIQFSPGVLTAETL